MKPIIPVAKSIHEILGLLGNASMLAETCGGSQLAYWGAIVSGLGLAASNILIGLKEDSTLADITARIEELAEQNDATLIRGIVAQPAAMALAFDQIVEMGRLPAASMPLDDIRRPWLLLTQWLDEKFKATHSTAEAANSVARSIREGLDTRFAVLTCEQKEFFDRQSEELTVHWENSLAVLRAQLEAIHAGVTKTFLKVDELSILFNQHQKTSSYEHSVILDAIVALNGSTHHHLPPSPISPVKPSNLPGGYIGQLFLGRDEFLETIRQSLTGGGHATAITQKPTVTGISGLGGIGKTHAAVEYAHRHRGDYSALLFASADTPEKLNSSLAGLCEVLLPDKIETLPPDESSRVRAALGWLAANPDWLLILDNVDDERAATALADHFGKFSFGHVLVTSRLHHWSKQVQKLDLSELSDETSVELIVELTDGYRRIADDDGTRARELAILLGGLPLAIQQAAGFINEQGFTLGEYINRFEEEAEDLLEWFSSTITYAGSETQHAKPEDIAPRPVLITWKTSFDRLSEKDRAWFLVFCHFGPEPIPEFLLRPLDTATPEEKVVLRTVGNAISRAGKYCLATRSLTEPFFKIHRLVQQITRLHAAEDECFIALQRAIKLIILANPGNSPDVRNWPKWNPLQPHAVSLCHYASDDSPPQGLGFLTSHLGGLFLTKCLFTECETFFRRSLKIHLAAYGEHHPEIANDLNNLAVLLQETNRLAESEPLMRRALRIRVASYGKNHPIVATSLNNLAQLLQDTNRLAEVEPMIREALRIDRAAYGDDHADVARDFNSLARLLHRTNRLVEAEPLMREALRIERAAYGENHPIVATSLNNLAGLLKDTNRLAEAEPLMREALRIDRAAYGDDHPMVAIRLSNLAGLLQADNRLSEAETMIRGSLRIHLAAYGNNHPKVAGSLNNLAGLLKDTNRLADAEPLMREALRINRAAYGDDHPDIARDLSNLAVLLQDTNRLAEAEQLMRNALRIDLAAYGGDHPMVAIRLSNLAVLLQATNHLDEAEQLMRNALRIDRAAHGDDHPMVAIRLNNLAQLLKDTNRLCEAESMMRESLRTHRASYSEDHPNVARCLNNLAVLLQDTNRRAEAEPLFREAVRILRTSLGPEHPTTVTVSKNGGILLEEMK